MMSDDERVLKKIAAAADGLSWMSETDHPLEALRWEGGAELTHEFLRGLTGHDSSAPVEERTAEEFFRAAASEPEWKQGAALETARRFQALARLLDAELSELKVYRVGEIDLTVYVVGRGPSGAWLGLRTRVVET